MLRLKCEYCGSDTALPFRCPFCGKYFCVEHRLPELHKCQHVEEASLARLPPLREYGVKREAAEARIRFKPILSFLSRLSSLTELIHLAIGVLLVMLIGLSIAIRGAFSINLSLALQLALVFTSAFILHELCHKLVAKLYGLWAEFRLTLLGVMITLVSIFSPIKIVSPGAVVVSGEADRKVIGKISLSGPLINLIFFMVFSVLSLMLDSLPLRTVFLWGSIINAFIALFNLIPFGPLDGAKVFWWNRYVWALAFTASLLSTITALTTFS